MVIAAKLRYFFFGYKKIAVFFQLRIELSKVHFGSNTNKSSKIIDDIRR